MSEERAAGAVVYAGAALVLVAGTVWWFAAAPRTPADDPDVRQRREAVELLVPDLGDQVDARTVLMTPAGSGTSAGELVSGPFDLVATCAGAGGRVQLRLAVSGFDSPREVPCTDPPATVEIPAVLRDQYSVSWEADGPTDRSVFRWRLAPH